LLGANHFLPIDLIGLDLSLFTIMCHGCHSCLTGTNIFKKIFFASFLDVPNHYNAKTVNPCCNYHTKPLRIIWKQLWNY